MQELNLIKQVVQVAFASGKITNIEEIKAIVIALERLEVQISKVIDEKIEPVK